MLPGFRFLFAAVVLSVSMLVFGLGAAALLRAAHEQFANLPLMRAPGAQFARQNDALTPTLTMLRVDPAPLESHVAEPALPSVAAPEPAAPEPEKVATLSSIERTTTPAPVESAKAEPAAPDAPVQPAPPSEASAPTAADGADKIATLAAPEPTALSEPAPALPPVDDKAVSSESVGEPESVAALGAPPISEIKLPPPRPALKQKVRVARAAEPAPRRHIRRQRPAKPTPPINPFSPFAQ